MKLKERRKRRKIFKSLDSVYKTVKSIAKDSKTELTSKEMLHQVIELAKPKYTGNLKKDANNLFHRKILNELYNVCVRSIRKLPTKSIPVKLVEMAVDSIKKIYNENLN